MSTNISRRMQASLAVAAFAVLALGASATVALGAGGKPAIEREVIEETFFDDFILDVCGVETDTTMRERRTIQTFPDGSQSVHRVVEFIADDPRIARERWARTDFFRPDGTLRIVGLAIRIYRRGGGGTIIRDAGWVQVSDDGTVTRGPHPFLENREEAERLYC